jgi:hypothetical protein
LSVAAQPTPQPIEFDRDHKAKDSQFAPGKIPSFQGGAAAAGSRGAARAPPRLQHDGNSLPWRILGICTRSHRSACPTAAAGTFKRRPTRAPGSLGRAQLRRPHAHAHVVGRGDVHGEVRRDEPGHGANGLAPARCEQYGQPHSVPDFEHAPPKSRVMHEYRYGPQPSSGSRRSAHGHEPDTPSATASAARLCACDEPRLRAGEPDIRHGVARRTVAGAAQA